MYVVAGAVDPVFCRIIVYVVAGAVDRVFCRIIEYVVAGAVVLGPRSGVHCEAAAYHVQAAA